MSFVDNIFNEKKKAVSVLSGGLDSTVATAYFLKDYSVHVVTFDYGQKSLDQEIKASREVCDYLGIKYVVIDIGWLSNFGSSSLTSDIDIPYVDGFSVSEDIGGDVWVPGRNMVFTSIAVSFAEGAGAEIVIVGWNKEEAINFPDSSKEFLDSFNKMINVGTKSLDKIEVKAPLIDLDKKKIIGLGKEINAPMSLSYSCYVGEEKHCGVCESCVRRRKAFIGARVEDPTNYEK
jgi:7-cyano-7-deazaguanine synthase